LDKISPVVVAQYPPLNVIKPSNSICEMWARVLIERPVATITLIPFRRRLSIAFCVESGILLVLKLINVPSISKNTAYILEEF
jgi:hypothetical protein